MQSLTSPVKGSQIANTGGGGAWRYTISLEGERSPFAAAQIWWHLRLTNLF